MSQRKLLNGIYLCFYRNKSGETEKLLYEFISYGQRDAY